MKVESEVPTPLVAKIPLSMGIYYTDSLRNYVYTENSEDRPNWNIKSGESQVELFNQVLPSMFTSTMEVSNTQDARVDGILSPQVEEMQFALPQETKTDLYEVWIKYAMHLYDPDGNLVANWPVTGYGKTSMEFLKSRTDGLQVAVNQALRDAGAKFALNFSRNTEVKQWLASKPDVCSQVVAVC